MSSKKQMAPNSIFLGTLFLTVLFTFPTLSLATISRINSLGGNGDFFEDDGNIQRWYGSLVDYPDQVVLESGNFNIPDGYWEFPWRKRSGPTIGAHFALGSDSRWGTGALFLSDHDNGHLTLHPSGLRNNISLFYALDLGPVAAALAYRHGTWEVGSSGDTDTHSADTFGAGLRMDLGTTAYLDLSGDLRSTSNHGSDYSTSDISNAESIYSLRGRAFIGLGPRTALVPVAEIFHEERLHPLLAPENPRQLDNQLVRFGIGVNHFPDTDHLLLLSLEYVDGRKKTCSSTSQLMETWTAWDLRAGFESRFVSWLTTRGSLGYIDFNSEKNWVDFQDPSNLMNLDGPILRVNLGASIHLGPADLDLSFGERYPLPHFQGQQFEPRKNWLNATVRLLF